MIELTLLLLLTTEISNDLIETNLMFSRTRVTLTIRRAPGSHEAEYELVACLRVVDVHGAALEANTDLPGRQRGGRGLAALEVRRLPLRAWIESSDLATHPENTNTLLYGQP